MTSFIAQPHHGNMPPPVNAVYQPNGISASEPVLKTSARRPPTFSSDPEQYRRDSAATVNEILADTVETVNSEGK